MKIAQIGLGRWGLTRCWAWHDVGATLIHAYDPVAPPRTRLPQNCVLALSVEEAVKHADIVCISTPPAIVAEIVNLVGKSQLLVVEKPGATTAAEGFKLLERQNIVIGYATIYDPCVARVVDEMQTEDVRYTAARLHQSNLHRDITVIEDLTVHDLVVCDKLGILNSNYEVSVSGEMPNEAVVTITSNGRKATIHSCVKSPNRVRFLRFENYQHEWNVNPDQFAICSDGRSVPPSQARPLFLECSRLIARAKDPRVKTEGDHERALRVWETIRRIRHEVGR